MLARVIDPNKYGISFSIKQCRNFDINPDSCLGWLLKKGWRRFRLMSYWNEHEKEQGKYDFSALDRQIAQIKKRGGTITLCLGVKQPRWPEYHWPQWARNVPAQDREEALLSYVEQVVLRYRDEPTITSYQLENEALLRGFGEHIDISRRRLTREYDLVKYLDPSRPLIMSTSNGWGIPLIGPLPDAVGFSLYEVVYNSQRMRYTRTIQRPWLHRLRHRLIRLTIRRPVFIHELQAEPWGPRAIWEMSTAEQDKSMNSLQIIQNILDAKSIDAYPIDLWGAEWWYWRWQQGDHSVYDAVANSADPPL